MSKTEIDRLTSYAFRLQAQRVQDHSPALQVCGAYGSDDGDSDLDSDFDPWKVDERHLDILFPSIASHMKQMEMAAKRERICNWLSGIEYSDAS